MQERSHNQQEVLALEESQQQPVSEAASAIAQVAFQILLRQVQQHRTTEVLVGDYRIWFEQERLKVATRAGRQVVEMSQDKTVRDFVQPIDVVNFQNIQQSLMEKGRSHNQIERG